MKRTVVTLFSMLALVTAHARISDEHAGHTRPHAVGQQGAAAEKSGKEENRVPIDVSPDQQARIGLKTSKVEKKSVPHTIRTVGNVTADQRTEAHVHTRINGWIETIYADYVGKPVKKGQPLYDLYSPELLSTEEEYLTARRQQGVGKEIASTARERLKLWGVPSREIDALGRLGKAKRAVTFDSPVDGFIIDKTAIRGMYVTPEMELYHIADLARIWILVTLYEYDLAAIQVGDEVEIQLPYDAATHFQAKISYLYPEIDTETRTGKARIELENKALNLKPGMFANVELKKTLGEAIVVPSDAVIDTGLRRLVFVKMGPERFEPREVRVGPVVDNGVLVLSGLQGGEEVVTGANFLIDAESKLQAALQKGAPKGGHAGHESH